MGNHAHSSPPANPVLRALEDAPIDDEPVTEKERRALEEAREDVARGDRVSSVEIRRRLGL